MNIDVDELFDRLDSFVMPTADDLKLERYIASLSKTEKQLYFIKENMLDGKIFRMNDERHDPRHTCYEDAVGFTLFCAVESGEISEEESDRLYEKYVC